MTKSILVMWAFFSISKLIGHSKSFLSDFSPQQCSFNSSHLLSLGYCWIVWVLSKISSSVHLYFSTNAAIASMCFFFLAWIYSSYFSKIASSLSKISSSFSCDARMSATHFFGEWVSKPSGFSFDLAFVSISCTSLSYFLLIFLFCESIDFLSAVKANLFSLAILTSYVALLSTFSSSLSFIELTKWSKLYLVSRWILHPLSRKATFTKMATS